jgi:transcriptional regulator with XRE-family HTH domain
MARPKGFQIDGRFVKANRENASLTQDDLARQCGLTRTVIQKAERNGPLSPPTIRALAAGLGCDEAALLISEDWTRNPEERHVTIFKPDAVLKIGTMWGNSREALYQLPPMLFLVIALRNAARIVVAYAPRSLEAERHFRNVLGCVQVCHAAINAILAGDREKVPVGALKKAADECYLAAAFARPATYEDDLHAADAAFAVAIAGARLAEGILIELVRDTPKETADYWRVIEFASSAWHAAGHASVYLTIESAYGRTSTLEIHDLRNSPDYAAVLSLPLWPDGVIPQALGLFLDRMFSQRHFPHDVRILWNAWARKEFVPSGPARLS